MHGVTRYVCLSLMLILPVHMAAAEVYRWVDERGQVHYGDRSRSQSASGVHSYTPPAASAENPQQRMDKTRKLLDAYRVERQQAREQQQEQKEIREKRRRNCAIAKDNLRQYQRYGAIYRLDKDGNRDYLDEQGRRNLLQKARDDVARWCD
jgi:hypothetical protein